MPTKKYRFDKNAASNDLTLQEAFEAWQNTQHLVANLTVWQNVPELRHNTWDRYCEIRDGVKKGTYSEKRKLELML